MKLTEALLIVINRAHDYFENTDDLLDVNDLEAIVIVQKHLSGISNGKNKSGKQLNINYDNRGNR